MGRKRIEYKPEIEFEYFDTYYKLAGDGAFHATYNNLLAYMSRLELPASRATTLKGKITKLANAAARDAFIVGLDTGRREEESTTKRIRLFNKAYAILSRRLFI